MIIHKQGSSWDYIFNIPEEYADGYYSDWTVTAQLRSAKTNTLLNDIVCEWSDETTRVLRLFILDTSALTLGDALMDIRFKRNSDGYVRTTTTEKVRIEAGVTSDIVPTI